MPWAILTAVTLLLGIIVGLWMTTPPSPEPTRLSVVLPENLRLTGLPQTFAPPIAISPDGRTLAITARQGGGPSQLFLRDLTSFDFAPVPGTEGATSPFFSPDGEWVGFHADGKLQKIPRSGGATVTICDAPLYAGFGIDWGPNGMIVFNVSTFSGIYQVPASGGTPQRITTPDTSNGERGHSWPQFLPDSSVLFSVTADVTGAAVLSLETGEWRSILKDADGAVYLPTGHLAYQEDAGFTPKAKLQVVPFDLERLEVSGSRTPVLDGIDYITRSGRANFAIAPTGHLAYVPARPVARWLTWVDRQGKSTRLTEEADTYQFPRISPDGRRVAFQLDQVWTLDLARGTRTRQTVEGFVNVPIWTPEGTHLVYAWNQRGPWNMFHKPVDASGDGELLLESEGSQFPMSWSPDGELLAFQERHPETGRDIWLLPRDGGPESFLATSFNEHSPRFSPDRRFIAYVSNESGRDEVYVQPYPTTGRKWTISTDGGSEPLWSRNGRELFYRNGDAVMAVDVETSEEFQPEAPRLLFEGRYETDIFPNYDISPDGKRFLMVESETPPAREIRVVLNWFEELKELVPTE